MNLYIVVEGRYGERIIYPQWIKYINNKLQQVGSLKEITNNTYYLISGNGYPRYYSVIDAAVEDINVNSKIDYLVIAVDSEDLSYSEKRIEIEEHLYGKINLDKVRIIIQHPCLEVWALGNKIAFKRHPEDENLRKYLRIYDVRILDPEGLPPNEEEGLNRCQFAFKYLKKILYDRYPNLTYTKSNPKVIMHEKFFRQIKLRYEKDSHITSFKSFLDGFS